MGRGASGQVELEEPVRASGVEPGFLSERELARRAVVLRQIFQEFKESDEFQSIDNPEIRKLLLDGEPFEMVDRFLQLAFEQSMGETATRRTILGRLAAFGLYDLSSDRIIRFGDHFHIVDDGGWTLCGLHPDSQTFMAKGMFNQAKKACSNCKEEVQQLESTDPLRQAAEEQVDLSLVDDEAVARVAAAVKARLRTSLCDSYRQGWRSPDLSNFHPEMNEAARTATTNICVDHFLASEPAERFERLFSVPSYDWYAGSEAVALNQKIAALIRSRYGETPPMADAQTLKALWQSKTAVEVTLTKEKIIASLLVAVWPKAVGDVHAALDGVESEAASRLRFSLQQAISRQLS